MKSKKGLALDSIALLVLGIVTFVIVLTLFSKLGFFMTVQTFFSPAMTTMGSYIRGVPIYFIWSFYDYARIAPTEWLGKDVGPIGGAFETIQNMIPLMAPDSPQIDMAYAQPCTQKGVSSEVFKKEVAKRTLDCWNMYTAGKFDPLMGKTPPNPRTCFVIQFNLNESVTFQDMKDYLFDASHGQSYMSKIQKSSDRARLIIENNKKDLSQEIKKGILYISYADLNSGNLDTEDCSNFELPDISMVCDFKIVFLRDLTDIFRDIYDSCSDLVKELDDACDITDVSSWDDCTLEVLDKISPSSQAAKVIVWIKNLVTDGKSIYEKANEMKSNAWKIVTLDFTAGDIISKFNSMKTFIIDETLSENFEFDLSSCRAGGDLLHNVFTCSIKKKVSQVIKDNDIEIATVTCHFKDSLAVGTHKQLQPDIQEIVSKLFDWPNFSGSGCEFDKVSNATIEFHCSPPKFAFYDLINSKPDHIFWCIDEDASYDENCNKFDWNSKIHMESK